MVLETVAAALSGVFSGAAHAFADSVSAAAGAAGAGVQSVWGYNQDLYNWDKTILQAAKYQRLIMRKEYVWLHREDIANLVDLTVSKMVGVAPSGGLYREFGGFDRQEDGRNFWKMWIAALV